MEVLDHHQYTLYIYKLDRHKEILFLKEISKTFSYVVRGLSEK